MFKYARRLFSSDIFVDLGTVNTLIYAMGQGIIIDEPSVIAIRQHKHISNGKKTVAAVGHKAKQMLNRTPSHLTAIRPMKGGVITNFNMAEKMLQYFIHTMSEQKFLHLAPRVLIGIPYASTKVERQAICEAATGAGAQEVSLIEESMVAAMGAGLPVSEATGSMVIDLGGGTTEIGILSLNGVVYSQSIRTGGDSFDEAIINYVRRHYNILIGEVTAERVKQEIGSAYPLDKLCEIEIWGRHLEEGVPRQVKLNHHEMFAALKEPLTNIVDAVKNVLENIPPELSSDIMEKGIVLTGGGALLKDIDRLLRKETKLPVIIANDPLTCVARGGGNALNIMKKQGAEVLSLSN
jgi:rod shape-determining protein MreB